MFIWDAGKAITNFEKHGISFEEAATAFVDERGLDWEDTGHSHHEKRYKRLGLASTGFIVLVVYTLRRAEDGQEKIRIISARQANRKERKAYAGP